MIFIHFFLFDSFFWIKKNYVFWFWKFFIFFFVFFFLLTTYCEKENHLRSVLHSRMSWNNLRHEILQIREHSSPGLNAAARETDRPITRWICRFCLVWRYRKHRWQQHTNNYQQQQHQQNKRTATNCESFLCPAICCSVQWEESKCKRFYTVGRESMLSVKNQI